MSLNAPVALEILEVAAKHPEGVSLPAERSEARYPELRRTFAVLVEGRFLLPGTDGRYLISTRGAALIKSLEKQIEKDAARKKRLSTLVLDVLGF